MKYIVDGEMYDEYPDEMERISNLRVSKDAWKALAMEEMKKRIRLERKIGEMV